ncbi:hypothetical protein AVEN_144047-1 [Araneus ventricosus]|uniref:Uncharacterized protein n=1 Tax=Araneus ventricosus TaxID=182803 RepID=A0A4Y2DES3_ARAVE|nr:hypothetical protein AVEN_144047-1 [Araneus ventricosus]
MPWKEDNAFLSHNYELPLKRLGSTAKKLEKIGYLEAYHQVFKEWSQEGIIEDVPKEELSLSNAHYLPHRPVIKEKLTSSSMKIRLVFDESVKTLNHPSLNDCLETGLNLIETIPYVLAIFRLQNCATSVRDVSELDNFIKADTEITKEAKFDVRGSEQTEIPACPFSNSMSQVLGLIWNKNSDTLEIDSEALKYDETIKITERKVLSIISSVFDPIGFIAPALL